MKSSTRNPSNLMALRTDARFNALVKQQMEEHQHVIGSHHKEMQALRDALSIAQERLESLVNRTEQDLQEFKTWSVSHICLIKDKIIADDALISEQKKTIESLHKQLLDFQDLMASKTDVEKSKKAVELQLKDSTNSHLNAFQDLQRELKHSYKSLEEDFKKEMSCLDQKLVDVRDKGEENFSISRIDRDGVLQEVRVYKMNMFIIEKKIENIYTLIERINKRGALCHKQE